MTRNKMSRRTMLGAAVVLPFAAAPFLRRADATPSGAFEVTRSEAEWRAMLTPAEYRVLREEGTERAGSSPLDKVYDPGRYHCKGCGLPVYPSETKYDSRTGWPSFWDALPDAVRTKPDRTLLFMVRTEVHCRRCGSHFGHVFDDGPAPTGKRHCLNGIALDFVAA
jgi:peptide-methionine (R)-S-oxide reductase